MGFPVHRPRRLRQSPQLRALVRETRVTPADLVLPLFFNAAIDAPRAISTMPGVFQQPLSAAAQAARDAKKLGLGGVILFGLPKAKDARGQSGLDPDGPVPVAVRAMKDAVPDLVVITDVCVDEYTDHGHCGLLRSRPDGTTEVDNDATLDVLAQMAAVHAHAGADIIAPSDMMDGRVAAIRRALDAGSFEHTPILSYAVKYASAFYGPFREAADCAPKFGDRAGYQMDPGNVREALREIAYDEEEGADMLMVKPALPYLDVVRLVREGSSLPLQAEVPLPGALNKARDASSIIEAGRALKRLFGGSAKK